MFATEGAKVAVVDIDAARATEVAESIAADGGDAISITCDVGKREQVQRAVQKTVAAFGTVDVLVNTAIAGAPRVPLLETTEELMDVMFRTGTLATLMFTQECHPHMKGKDGAIVNFASGGAISGDIGYAAYAPAKEGVRVLTKVAARELGPDGIRVNAVCPAAKTRLMQDWIDENPGAAEATRLTMPLQRFGDPDLDIPLAVVFLASDYARFVTGHTLMVDGGSCRW